ncbi:hypothetical protein FQZ97_1001290 [compost metagenome]
MRGGDGHALGAVDGGAAAHGDEAVAAAAAVQLDGGAHRGLGRVGGRLVEHRDLEIGDGVERLLQHAGRAHAGVGDDQGAVDADARALARQELDGAEFELDLGEVLDEGHEGERPRAVRLLTVRI